MATIRKTIILTEKHDEWIKTQISSGDYTNESEYLRDLIRKDQAEHEKLLALQAAIQDGIDSGDSDRSVEDIWQEVEADYKRSNT